MAYIADLGGTKKKPSPTPYQQPTQVRPPGYAWETPGGNIYGHGAVVEDTPSWVAPQLRPTETYELDPSKVTPTSENPPKTDEPPATGGGGDQPTAKPDWHNDPFLNMLLGPEGQMETDLKKRRAAGLAKKQQILLGFGSKELARKVLGPDDPFLGLISDDPLSSTSWLANRNNFYNLQRRDFNEASNEANLWYGGGRFLGLAQSARTQLGESADYESQQIAPQLTAIDEDIAAAQAAWNQKIFDTSQAAYNRALPTAAAA